jgi:hypothetical protein
MVKKLTQCKEIMETTRFLSFQSLSALYDVDETLPISDRLDLYFALLNEPLVRDDVFRSISNLENHLKKIKDIPNLKKLMYLYTTRNISSSLRYWLNSTKTLFSDPQNVHTLNSSTIQVASHLVSSFPSTYQRNAYGEVDEGFLDHIERCVGEFSPCEERGSTFTLPQLFASVFEVISRSEKRDEMMVRLKEEIFDSRENNMYLCITGIIGRLVNVLRGYSDFEIVVDSKEMNKARVFHYLTSNLDVFDLKSNDIEKVINSLDPRVWSIDENEMVQILTMFTCEPWYHMNGRYFMVV